VKKKRGSPGKKENGIDERKKNNGGVSQCGKRKIQLLIWWRFYVKKKKALRRE